MAEWWWLFRKDIRSAAGSSLSRSGTATVISSSRSASVSNKAPRPARRHRGNRHVGMAGQGVKKVTTYGSTGGRRPGKFRLAGLLGCQSALNFDPISARGLINDAAGGQERPFVQTRASSQLAGFCFIVTTVPSGANIARTMSR